MALGACAAGGSRFANSKPVSGASVAKVRLAYSDMIDAGAVSRAKRTSTWHSA